MYEGIVYIVFFGIVVEVALPAALFTAPGCITVSRVNQCRSRSRTEELRAWIRFDFITNLLRELLTNRSTCGMIQSKN